MTTKTPSFSQVRAALHAFDSAREAVKIDASITKKLLVRCPECKRENYAPVVADGICAWCGFDINKPKL